MNLAFSHFTFVLEYKRNNLTLLKRILIRVMKPLFLFLAIFLVTKVNAQDFDHLAARPQIECSDISLNSSLLFEDLFLANKTDSAAQLLTYWRSRCGMREPIHRANILLALKNNQFQDSLLTDNALYFVFNYLNRLEMIREQSYFAYDNYKPYFGFVPVGQEFDNFTIRVAKELKRNFESGTIEYLLCDFYSGNEDILSSLQAEDYRESAFASQYHKVVDMNLHSPEFHMGWITGVWIPTGALSKLGAHPELGFQMGYKKKKMNYDLTMALKFLNSPNEFYARRPKSDADPELTDYFFGGYIGVDVGRDVYVNGKHEMQITGGIAFDGFTVLEADEDNNMKSASANSYNFNLGMGYRYYLNPSFYLGLKVKYNLVDYTLTDVIDFSGFPITIHFLIGGFENSIKRKNLKDLKYKWRE